MKKVKKSVKAVKRQLVKKKKKVKKDFGRPPIFKSPEKLQAKITDYFKNPRSSREVISIDKKTGKINTLKIPIYTISGLAIHCGFCSRATFYEYEKKPDFSYTIKRARFLIEEVYEGSLHNDKCTGAIFALKNLGWADNQSLEVKGEGIIIYLPKREKIE